MTDYVKSYLIRKDKNMSSDKLLIVLVGLFLIAELIQAIVEGNSKVKKQVQSNRFLNFVYQDAVGYAHIFEKTEMPNKAKLNGAIDQVVADAQAHGFKVTDQDRALIEGAVEYAVNKMHLANNVAEETDQNSKPSTSDLGSAGTAQTISDQSNDVVNQTVPDAPQLPKTVNNNEKD